jgi:hypothetical protein
LNHFYFDFAAVFSAFVSFFSDFSDGPLFSLLSEEDELEDFSAFGSGELFPP